MNISQRAQVVQWLLPIDPSVYKSVVPRLKERIQAQSAKEHASSVG